ncbi:hypothetical protein [Neorickettsia sp. 179522]|nr:hypothetical protein [Neorickettsia sp. 179522]
MGFILALRVLEAARSVHLGIALVVRSRLFGVMGSVLAQRTLEMVRPVQH